MFTAGWETVLDRISSVCKVLKIERKVSVSFHLLGVLPSRIYSLHGQRQQQQQLQAELALLRNVRSEQPRKA